MWFFRATTSSTFITSDVQSIYIPPSIRESIPGVRTFEQQTDSVLSPNGSQRQESLRILIRSTWVSRVMHKTCTKHGEDIKTQYIGSSSILLLRKGLTVLSERDRTLSFFMKHFQLIVFRNLSGWKMEKSYTKKHTCHLGFRQRSPWRHEWKRRIRFRTRSTTRSTEVGQPSGSFQSNQPIPNPSRDRSGQTRCQELTREPCEDGRKTSRSQEIDVNSFHEETVSSESTFIWWQ